MKRALKIGYAAQFPDLHFVALPRECIVGVIPRNEPGPNVQISMHWNVTNASSFGMPARLVRARLVKPRLSDSEATYIYTGSTNGRMYPNEDIPPGAMRRLTTVFVGVLPSIRVKKPIKVQAIVIDQLSREHRLRPITTYQYHPAGIAQINQTEAPPSLPGGAYRNAIPLKTSATQGDVGGLDEGRDAVRLP